MTQIFQNDFDVSLTSLVNNGIYEKIERDLTTSTEFKGYFDIMWTPEMLHSNTPLNIDHALPAFIALGLGLIPATVIFLLEITFFKKMIPNKVIGSVPRPGSRQAPTLNDPKVVDLESPGRAPEQRQGLSGVDELEDLVQEDPLPKAMATTKKSEVKETP